MTELSHIQKQRLKKRDKPILVKLSPFERAKIQKKADQYTNGNRSEWIRWAAINMIPSDGQLANVNTQEANDKEVMTALNRGMEQHKDTMERLAEND